MKKLLSTILLGLVSMTVLAQGEKTWNNVVFGYASAPIINVQKVTFASDRTEVFLQFKIPEHQLEKVAGQELPLPEKVTLKANGQEYVTKDATVITLGKSFKMPANGQLDFSFIFEPLPTRTKLIDMVDIGGLQIQNIRDLDSQPEDLADTYWRNEATGDWLIGFAPSHVVYQNKVWDIASQTEKKDVYTLTLADGPTIKVGKMKKGLRTITIGQEKPVVCSPITSIALPDYPTKDLRTGFVDNGYSATDSVTIAGWLKDMPERVQQKGREFEVSFVDLIMDDQHRLYTTMDSLGRFFLRIPLINSSQAYLDLGRSSLSTVLEPGKTYFYLNDFKTGQQLFMGDDARVQNELIAYPDKWNYQRIENAVSAMQFKAQMDSICSALRAELDKHIAQRPNLSQRYIDFVNGYYLMGQGESMMQARFDLGRKMPQEYTDFVTTELWKKVPKPYTLQRPLPTFMRDYLDHMAQADYAVPAGRYTMYVSDGLYSSVLRKNRAEGKVAITDEELALLDRYAKDFKAFLTNQFKARADAGATSIDDIMEIDSVASTQFNQQDFVEQRNALLKREDIAKVLEDEAPFFEIYKMQKVLDETGVDQALKDIALARHFYKQIDQTRKPLAPAVQAFFEEQVHLPAALKAVKTINDKYLALESADFANAASLRPSSDVEGMSDGEKILRKIIEPYKGRIIYVDIWGTWCGPCKRNLKESWKVKEALKDYDIVYLYLANRSSDESWRNVIKEYNLTGENCVHYNLPEDQQTAVEHYVGVNGYPTYKLIDKEGNIHDLHWLHHEDMDSFLKTIDQMSK